MTNMFAKYSQLGNYIDHGVKEPIRIISVVFKDTEAPVRAVSSQIGRCYGFWNNATRHSSEIKIYQL